MFNVHGIGFVNNFLPFIFGKCRRELKKESKSLPHSFVRRFALCLFCAFSFVSFLVTNFLFAYTRQHRQHPSKSASSIGSLTHTLPTATEKRVYLLCLFVCSLSFSLAKPISPFFSMSLCSFDLVHAKDAANNVTTKTTTKQPNEIRRAKKEEMLSCIASKQQANESERLNNFEHVADWYGVRKVNTFFPLSFSLHFHCL